eukprot:EG_transcript_15717
MNGPPAPLECVATPAGRSALMQSWLAHLDRWDALGAGADDGPARLPPPRTAPRECPPKGSRASSTGSPASSLGDPRPGLPFAGDAPTHCTRNLSGLSSGPSSPLDPSHDVCFPPCHSMRATEASLRGKY